MRALSKPEPGRACPYCGAIMTWIPLRWFGRGTFACDRCGEFPDLRPRADAPGMESFPAPARPPLDALVCDTRPRVLMIDDSTAERDLYALMLERDVQVLTAARGSGGVGAGPGRAARRDRA